MDKKRVVVGMSGGVDSSVAAHLLLKQGFDVVGLFMHNWEESEGGACTSASDWEDARDVSAKIGIPCYSVNFSAQYMERVFKFFLAEYKAGRTPNPDVLCNREIKFAPFKDYAFKLGADYIATGHYCDVAHYANNNSILLKAADEGKDQTYFLNQISTAQLNNVLFPLAKMQKAEVRKIAEQEGLITAKKKDSTGICFIGERKFKEFLATYLPAQKGKIISTAGDYLGDHTGLMYYTLGQRKGLGIGGKIDYEQSRWYVVKKDLPTNTLIVSCGEGDDLLSNSCTTDKFNQIGNFDFPNSLECTAKFRYRQAEQAVTVTKNTNDTLNITFKTPLRAVTPGQYAVLYASDRCLGGSAINETAPLV